MILRGGFLGLAGEEKTHQVGNVLFVLAQWRDVYGHNIQPVIEVFTEGAFLERRTQVPIGRGHQAHIHFDGTSAAKAFELPLLQNAKQFHLRRSRHVTDFIEEECSFDPPVQTSPVYLL